jgi:hypothetical protein
MGDGSHARYGWFGPIPTYGDRRLTSLPDMGQGRWCSCPTSDAV